jgi:serine/threonine protein kinase
MDRIGKYTIEKKLGQGGMGIVYKCMDTEQQRLAAVKVLPQQLAADPAFLQRFRREVTTLQRLDNPNIVKIYDQGEYDGAYYYAMEYVDGVSLESMLDERERMAPLRALSIIKACAEALKHSHAQGIIHRDIKPANIMFTAQEEVKLMDFGIAKVLDATRMTATQGVLGTVEYMSPEQSQGRHVDARSDMYSLGVVLYQCLTARLPITGTTPTEIIMKLRTQQVDPPSAWVPSLPRSMDELVARMLVKDPARRIESATELLREVERVEKQISTGTGIPASVSKEAIITSGVHTAPWRNPWLIALAIGATGLIGYQLLQPKPAAETAQQEPPVVVQPVEPSVAQAGTLLRWARRAVTQGKFEYATDLCDMVMRHFPDSKQAEEAEAFLPEIDKAREEAAKLAQSKTAQPQKLTPVKLPDL